MKQWIRKSDLDTRIEGDPPIPTGVISNEEYAPPSQTRAEREAEERVEETASRLSRQLGKAAAFESSNLQYGRVRR